VLENESDVRLIDRTKIAIAAADPSAAVYATSQPADTATRGAAVA
jgi:hypothetical protein